MYSVQPTLLHRRVDKCFWSAHRLVSSRLGGRGGKESLNQIGKGTDFAVGRLSRPVGNRKAARESANERRPIADRYAHMFAEGGEFIDSCWPSSVRRSTRFWNQDQPWDPIRTNAQRVDDLEGAHGCLEVKARGIHGTRTRSEIAQAAPSERSLGAVSITTQSAFTRCTSFAQSAEI